MSNLKCEKCLSVRFHKSGHTGGLPRYKCKECGCQFTDSPRRGVDPALKALAIMLYAYCGLVHEQDRATLSGECGGCVKLDQSCGSLG